MSDPAPKPDLSPESNGDEEIQPFVITMPDDPSSGGDWYLWAAVLALIALVAFWPAINGTFIWDDEQYVTQNRALQSPQGLVEIWKIPPGTIQYYPLTFTALWIEHQIWGNNSLGYRVVNLLLHAGAAIVLWRILRRLKIPGAWAAAAIWAVHPIQAESVCWISECKNVLSGVLALGSVLFYLEFAGIYDPDLKRRTWNLTDDWQPYAISAAMFILAMLAKTAVVFLPLAILAILWWKNRLTFARIAGAVPMLIIGGLLALVTSRLETNPNGAVGAYGPEWQLSFAQRLLISGRDFWFYIGKLLVPIHQSFVYPRIVPGAGDAVQWLLVAAAVALLAVLVAASSKLGKGPAAAMLWYLLLIFPALGFFNVYPFRFSFVADHFQYLAGIGVIVLVVSILAAILSPLWRVGGSALQSAAAKSSPVIAIMVAALLVILGAAAWIRADVFSEPAKLWEDVLLPDKNPDSWLAAYNLAHSRQGDAKSEFDQAGDLIEQRDIDAANDMGNDAMAQLNESNRLLQLVMDNSATPPDVLYKAHDLWAQNDILRLRSPDSDANAVLAHARDEAETALASPAATGDPLPYYTLALVDRDRADLLLKNTTPTTRPMKAPATTRPNTPAEQQYTDLYISARDQFRNAQQLAEAAASSTTIAPEAAQVLPLAALESGNIDWKLAGLARQHGDARAENIYSRDAVTDYSNAARLNPRSEEAHFHLAIALENINKLDEAREQLMVILRDINPYNADAYNEIGRVILESRVTDVSEFNAAVESFKEAIKLNPNLVDAQRNLALAMRMWATSRPSTRATTMPATQP